MKKPAKPAKPYDKFPLFAHASGHWCKKIHGKHHYFGRWADGWEAALQLFEEQREALYAGLDPQHHRDGIKVRDLVNDFLNAKRMLMESGELTNRSFQDYKRTCELVCEHLTKTRTLASLVPLDFSRFRAKLAKTRGPTALGNEINRARVVFKFAYDIGLLEAPMRFGPDFRRPAARQLRLARAAKGQNMLEAFQILAILKRTRSSPAMRAMTLLGINCGLGNNDCGSLEFRHLDGRWLVFPRPKTGIVRRAWLWKETLEAINEASSVRPAPKNEAHTDRVFLTKYGAPWTSDKVDNPITKEFRKLLDSIEAHRRGIGFYALRHTFETIGGETQDQVAVDMVMGHAAKASDMSAVYRERVGDQRLVTLSNHVHKWLFSAEEVLNEVYGNQGGKPKKQENTGKCSV